MYGVAGATAAPVLLGQTRPNSARHIAFEGVAAGDHGEAILELDEAAIHRATGEDEAALVFAAVAVPAEDVEGVRGAHGRCHDQLNSTFRWVDRFRP